MVTYALRRIAYGVVLVLGVATMGFFLIHLVPGDPARPALGPRASDAAVSALEHRFGLDQPFLTQYWHFLRGAVTLDFGSSIYYRVRVASLVGSRIVPTVGLIVYGVTVAVVLAVPLAVIAAVRRDRPLRRGSPHPAGHLQLQLPALRRQPQHRRATGRRTSQGRRAQHRLPRRDAALARAAAGHPIQLTVSPSAVRR
jgi:ABC-type microcin C transport system permease subunit YejB